MAKNTTTNNQGKKPKSNFKEEALKELNFSSYEFGKQELKKLKEERKQLIKKVEKDIKEVKESLNILPNKA